MKGIAPDSASAGGPASLAGVYNTRFRSDRFALQFFVRTTTESHEIRSLPRPTTDGGSYVFDLDSHIFSSSHIEDRVIRRWDAESEQWQDAPEFRGEEMRSGDGVMRIGGGLLVFRDSEATFEDRKILGRPDV